MADIQIRELQREDFSLVRTLYRTAKNRQRSEDYDRWCFFDTAWGDSIGVIAVDGGLCVSMFVLRPAVFDIGGEIVPGAQATDLMTHPDYRGRGLFLALAEESLRIASGRGFDIVYAFPNSSSYPGFARRLNFDHVGDVLAWDYDLRRPRLRSPAWWPLKRARVVMSRDDVRPGELESLMRASGDERDVCRVRRDQTWLGWRYARASGETCHWHTARDAAGTLQAAILAGERDASWGGFGKGHVRIHEAFSLSGSALAALFAGLTREARSASKERVRMFVKDAVVESALRTAGFKASETHPLMVRRLSARLLKGNVHLFAAWRVVGGDFDGF